MNIEQVEHVLGESMTGEADWHRFLESQGLDPEVCEAWCGKVGLATMENLIRRDPRFRADMQVIGAALTTCAIVGFEASLRLREEWNAR
jgi:hypothetical protein